MNTEGVKTAMKNLFPLWDNGKKKVKKKCDLKVYGN